MTTIMMSIIMVVLKDLLRIFVVNKDNRVLWVYKVLYKNFELKSLNFYFKENILIFFLQKGF